MGTKMTVSGQYTLNLKCASMAHPPVPLGCKGVGSFEGITRRQAVSMARSSGWRFICHDVLCPYCVEARAAAMREKLKEETPPARSRMSVFVLSPPKKKNEAA
jgi:hypothetical protein